jgi:ABC-type enterochelin transport system permease subunit
VSADSHKTANRAILALTLISVLALVGGLFAVLIHEEAGAVLAVVTGAVGGIVAIVLRQSQNGNG